MEDTNGKPLTNADFRKILFTPRPGAGKPDLAAQAKERANAEGKKERRQRPPRPKPNKQEKGDGDDAEDGDDKGAYRDRATERRLGLDADDDAAVLGSSTATHLAGISYEDSKFLGGDVAHTHLVKGLDFALLNRIRSEQQQQGAAVNEEEVDGEIKPGRQLTSDGGPLLPPKTKNAAAVTFATPLGRALYESLFEQQRQAGRAAAAAERFLPRRTAFVFDLEAADPRQVPTTLARAKEDCPPPPKVLPASADAAVLERLSHILAYVQVGGSGMKKAKRAAAKKQEQAAAAALQAEALPPSPVATACPVDEDEDIFADAGTDYVAERRRDSAAVEEGAEKRAYFEGPSVLEEDAAGVIGPSAAAAYPDADEAYPDTDAAFVEAEAVKREAKKKEKEREAKRREMLEAAADDGYAECYPSYFDAAGAVYDSEDDDGTGAAKAKAAEEEATAAAAAPDGGAAKKDGKKLGTSNARREAYKLAMKEKAKQEAELNKLQKVFEDKGYGNAGAFLEKKSPGGGGGGGGKDKERRNIELAPTADFGIEQEDVVAQVVPPVKKRRI